MQWHVQATFDVMWEGSTCTEYSPLRLSKELMQFNQNGESTFSPFSPRRSREQTAITKCFEHAQSATQTLTDCMPISRTQDNKEQKSSLSCSFFSFKTRVLSWGRQFSAEWCKLAFINSLFTKRGWQLRNYTFYDKIYMRHKLASLLL